MVGWIWRRAGSFTLVAGTSPGASNIGVFPMGLATTVTANAPEGVPIYVRVVATNAFASAASSQIDFMVGGAVAPIIPQQAVYRVEITGIALQAGGVSSTFSLPGHVVVAPPFDPRAIGVFNGPNPIDLGIFTDASPILGVAGALYFGSNTGFCRLIGCSTFASAIDTTFVAIDQRQGTVNVVVDGNVFGLNTARLSIFNIFNIRTSIVAQIYNVLAGGVALQFTNGGQGISGNIVLGGSSGFGGAAVTTEYRATVNGRRIQ